MDYIGQLKTIQKYSGKTQTQLARMLGVSFPTFNSWINIKSIPRKKAQEKIEALYFEHVGKLDIEESVLIEKYAVLESLRKKYKKPFKLL